MCRKPLLGCWLIAGALVALAAFAAPSAASTDIQVTAVVGTIADGQTITIMGSGFGEKSPAAPVIWDDFDSGTPGQLIGDPLVGRGQWELSNEGTFYNTDQAWSGGQSARCIYEDHWNGGLAVRLGSSAQRYAFASMKIRNSAADVNAPNRKVFRLTASTTSDYVHGYPNVKSGSDRDRTTVELSYANNGKEYLGYATESSGWNSYQLIGRFGQYDVPEGYAGVRLNGQLYADDPVTWTNPDYFDEPGFTTAAFCCYISGDSNPFTIYLDDCYADNSLARIEIVGSSGIHEMQIPITWASNQITATFNPGRYASGSSVDLYVYDADNNRSPAFSITVGGSTGDPGPPGEPGQPHH